MSPEVNKHHKNWVITTAKPKAEKTPKKREKKTRDSTRYLIHVYEDKGLNVFLKCPPCRSNNRKDALKVMKEYAYQDIVKGHYHFYELIEQKMTSISIYPENK
jgi:hypothetical protein